MNKKQSHARDIFRASKNNLASNHEEKIDAILAEVRAEMIRAVQKHGPMNTAHEAFGVIYEEFNIEYADAMHHNDKAHCRLELIQVAAMAARAVLDVFNGRK